MIDVLYDRGKHRLTVKGHAKSAEKGKDLVCAAASILAYTLAKDVEGLCEDKRRVRRPKIVLEDGNAVIECSPIHGMTAVVTIIFDSVCEGYAILAAQYPDFVRYKIEG